jgi:hypothetical protein
MSLNAWRCIKMSTHKNYDYVGLEFNMATGSLDQVVVSSRGTSVRKKSTPQFEICENGQWITLPNKDVKGLIVEFNKVRIKNGLLPVDENNVLASLYQLEGLR